MPLSRAACSLPPSAVQMAPDDGAAHQPPGQHRQQREEEQRHPGCRGPHRPDPGQRDAELAGQGLEVVRSDVDLRLGTVPDSAGDALHQDAGQAAQADQGCEGGDERRQADHGDQPGMEAADEQADGQRAQHGQGDDPGGDLARFAHVLGCQQGHQHGADRAAEGDHRPAGQVDPAGDDDDGRPQGENPQERGLPQDIDGTGVGVEPVVVLGVQERGQHEDDDDGRQQAPFGPGEQQAQPAAQRQRCPRDAGRRRCRGDAHEPVRLYCFIQFWKSLRR